VAAETEQGHGRTDTRKLETTTILTMGVKWPGLAQGFRITRTRVVKGVTTTEVHYGITSLTEKEAGAKRLLELVRGHWRIENGLHWVRDVTMGEDACRVRRGAAPQVLAAFRNMAVFLLSGLGPPDEAPNRARAMRRLGANAPQAMQLLDLPPLE
jgi:predicted transposase YbfD/YdcC